MIEFKGTKGQWRKQEVEPTEYSNAIIFGSNGEIVCEVFNGRDELKFEYNVSLLTEAGNVRQQINCSLTELHERYGESISALEDLAFIFERLVNENKVGSNKPNDFNCYKKAIQEINKFRTNEP